MAVTLTMDNPSLISIWESRSWQRFDGRSVKPGGVSVDSHCSPSCWIWVYKYQSINTTEEVAGYVQM